ncbi:hypothetical protein GCM10010421_02990 [Streptomyces glaucus]|uniref:Transposase n=1 Tax=Streptomyces glaucus TaxID=284029 RepID=A0ABP5W896_9ACTN
MQKASETRIAEVSEDMPWARDAIGLLAGHQVPIEQVKVEVLWEEHRLVDALRKWVERYVPRTTRTRPGCGPGPRHPEHPELLIEELVALGVMRRRCDGRIDLPDVYRFAIGVGRKEGFPGGRAEPAGPLALSGYSAGKDERRGVPHRCRSLPGRRQHLSTDTQAAVVIGTDGACGEGV